MHVLILPSEQFLPTPGSLDGIFQFHQAQSLRQAGYKVGLLSVSQSFSIPMLAKAALNKTLKRSANPAVNGYSSSELIRMGFRKIFRPNDYLRIWKKGDLPVYHIDGLFFLPPVENKNHLSWTASGMIAYQAYVRDNGKPDIIHAHNVLYAGMLARKIKQRFNVPYVITEHSTIFARNLLNDESVRARVKTAYTESMGIAAVSEPFAELLNRQFEMDRFICIPNVIDPEFEEKPVLSSLKRSEEFTFLNIADLSPKKDHAMLLKAFKRVHNVQPQARLIIGGTGILADELKQLAASLGLGKVVSFPGLLNREAVYKLINASDCFALSSQFETFGVVVMEALLYGKPVVVTKCGGPESFVDESNGRVCASRDPEQFAEAMLAVMDSYNDFNAESIRRNTLNRFGKAAFLTRIEHFYKKVPLNVS
jgi:teichuronic acid biosynthesis glycosyltransferase TuaC